MYFSFTENMYGTYTLLGDESKRGRFDFHCSFGSDDLRELLTTKTTVLKGWVDMEGFATRQPLEGTLKIDLVAVKELVYDFTFTDDRGVLMHFFGKKNVKYLHLPTTMTTLFGVVERENIPFAKVESHFKLRELPRFILSFKIRPGSF